MNFSEFLTNYWSHFETRVLMTNFANQAALGLVESGYVSAFSDHLANLGIPAASVRDVLRSPSGGGFSLEDYQLKSMIGPSIDDEQLFFRAAPLAAILKCVDMDGREAVLEKQLKIFSDMSNDPLIAKKAERRLERAFQSQKFRDFEGDWQDDLETVCDYALEASILPENGVGFSSIRSKSPKFVAHMTDEAGNENEKLRELKNGPTTSTGASAADYARDLLGLDHYTKTRNGMRTVLGFVVFRADQLKPYVAKRPTVFDDTSALRFRGAGSCDLPDLQDWGRTADLAKLHSIHETGSSTSILGSPEIVMDNPGLEAGNHCLVGYLGPLELARDDTNDLDPATHPDEYAKMQELHELFLTKCLGAKTSTDVHASIFA